MKNFTKKDALLTTLATLVVVVNVIDTRNKVNDILKHIGR